MKTSLLVISLFLLDFTACERHPASHLAIAKEAGNEKGGSSADKAAASRAASTPSGTPKTYFPENS
ncbi:MAG: hypothetical protein JO076_14675 [Verrucomicrobia bacterium]|nr:hypothetical protein [Verrucomicrobiota bacterium]